MTQPDALIIGGGLAGLAAASVLTENGRTAIVLEKGRGPGGRMSTRRMGEDRFDHGAQYFSAKTTEFQDFIKKAEAAGVVKKWTPAHLGDGHPRWAGASGMNSLPKFLAKNLTVLFGQKIVRLEQNNGWTATTESGQKFSAPALVVTMPAPQALELLENSGLGLPPVLVALRQISYFPCLAVLVRLDRASELPAPGGLALEGQPIAWLADNFQKGISPGPTVTIHASPAYSQQHLEADLTTTGDQLLQLALLYLGDVQVLDFQTHRWRYSLADQRHPEPFFNAGTEFPMLFGGDGFGMGNVEGAFLSGRAMAQHLLEQSSRRVAIF